MVGLVAVDGVLGECAPSPRVGSSHAVDVEVDVEVDKLSASELMRVLDCEVFLPVVPCADAQRLAAFDAQLMMLGGNGETSDIAAVSVVLRPDVFGHVF